MKLAIIGSGDNAGALIDFIQSEQENTQILLSDVETNRGGTIHGVSVTFTDDDLLQVLQTDKSLNLIVSYAKDMKRRALIYNKFAKYRHQFVSMISKRAYVSKTARIEKACIVMPNVSIRNDVLVRENVVVNTGAVVEHGCRIGLHCHIAPGAVITGNVVVEEGCFIGANSTILPNLTIGAGSIIGAGAVVTKHVGRNEVWVGNPAKRVRKEWGDKHVSR